VEDSLTGLTYMQQRFYDPGLGVFLSRDPMTVDTTTGWNFNRSNYAANNPYKFKDPDGRAIETAWDAFNVGLGFASFIENAKAGNWGAAAVDVAGVVVDSTATVVPFVPAGASTGIRIARGAEKAPGLIEGASSLVGADRAVIDPRKLTDYALNPAHPVGGHKARVFESALGFNATNADELMVQLRHGVMHNTPVAGKVDKFGSRFTVDIPVVGPNGSGVVRSGWIYKQGSDTPELTTLLVK
jgi:RHS repeat-associated protein